MLAANVNSNYKKWCSLRYFDNELDIAFKITVFLSISK